MIGKKDFVDFLNKEENESLRFLLRLQLYKMGYYNYIKEKEENSMTAPNPEERRIFMDAPWPTCQKCVHSNKKETEEPCVSCKWLSGNMGDSDFYKKKENKDGK